MGFHKAKTVYKLVFPGTELEGLEIRIGSMTLRETMDVQRILTSTTADADASIQQNDALLTAFTDHLISWNLEDENGQLIPMTPDSLMDYEQGFVASMIEAWMQQITAVPKTLNTPSSAGETSPELSMPMEAL